MIQFRPLQSTNHESFVQIAGDLGIKPLYDDLNMAEGNEYLCFLALDGDQVIGYCLYRILGNGTAHLNQIFIKPEERKCKLGDGLFRSVLNSLELNGVKSVIASGNSDELAFYKREGLIENDGNQVVLDSISVFFSKPCKGHKK